MNSLEPINQKKLFGLDKYLNELIRVYEAGIYPNKLLLSGQKGTGKSTLAFHFINYVLSKDEDTSYDKKKYQINSQSPTFKTILNQSNLNISIIDIKSDKKSIDINQIRELILNLNKSSFNTKPRFVLIDNIEYLNINSINALLKVLEEPNSNIYFILINNNKKILATLLSRCVNYKIYLTNEESLKITNSLFNGNLKKLINDDLIDYYLTPGKLYNLIKFAELHQYNLIDFDLRKFLKIIIKKNHYKKDLFMKSFYDEVFTFTQDEKYINEMLKIIKFYEKFFIHIVSIYSPKFKIENMSLSFTLPVYI